MRVVVAGTFGPVHDGHRQLFETALKYGDEVLVGVTTDEMATASRTRDVPAHDERLARVREEIDAIDEWDRDVEYHPLADEEGFAVTEPDVDALVVSPETAPEIADINATRRERGFAPIEGIVAPYVLAADGERISSTRIVAGEIDEHGTLLER